ncbi:MAG: NAD(P)/FAD-dependent oxidoreductase, partial [Acidimicrobiales bacterium]
HVVDQAGPASGDSGRTFGMVRHHYSNDVTAALALRSIDTLRNWSDEVGVGDPGYVPCGYLVTADAATVEGCRANVARSVRLGGEERFVDADDLPTVEPLLALDPAIAGGAYEPWGGYADVHRVVLGWLTAAAARGARLSFGRTVTGFDVSGSRVVGVRTDAGTLAAGHVLVAAGAWTRDLLAPIGVALPIALRRIPIAVLEARPGTVMPTVVCSEAASRIVVRPERSMRFWVAAYGGESELGAVEDCDITLTPDFVPVAHARLSTRFPSLADARVATGWAGVYDYTPDWNPVVGPLPGFAHLHVTAGTSGHGFKLAPAIGECMAAALLGSPPPLGTAALRPDRFAGGHLLDLAYGPGARA